MQIDHFASAILVRRPICSWRMASYILDDALVSTRKGYLIFRSLTKAIFQSSDCCGKGTAADGLYLPIASDLLRIDRAVNLGPAPEAGAGRPNLFAADKGCSMRRPGTLGRARTVAH
jgi:hypothetical protein